MAVALQMERTRNVNQYSSYDDASFYVVHTHADDRH